MPSVPQAADILACLGQATFVWDIATDAIAWSANAASIFPNIPRRNAGERRGVLEID